MNAHDNPTRSTGAAPRGVLGQCLAVVRVLVGGVVGLAIVGFFLFGELIRFFDPASEGAFAEVLALSELSAQLRVPFGLWAFVGVGGLLLLTMWRTAVVCLVISVVAVWPLWRLRPTTEPLKALPSGALRFVAANVLASNDQMLAVFANIEREGPDVIALAEVTTRWRDAALAHFDAEFPFRADGSDHGEWKAGACGQLLLSRWPILSTKALEVHRDGVELRPVVEAVLDWNGTPLTVQVIHPVRPTLARRLRARMAILDRVASAGPAPEMHGERIVLGDFNTTSSSPLFTRLVEATGLRDSRVGFGMLPTYTPSHPLVDGRLPFGWQPSVTIDHALVSPGLGVVERGIMELPGSDHRGVTLTVVLRAGG